MLTVSGLCVDYGSKRIIHELDLALAEDEILMLVGPTGCGKTTILQALAGLITVTRGTVSLGHWQATPENPVPPERRNVGMVFQDFALFPHLSVEQNVAFRLSDPAQAHHWLQIMGMSDYRQARPGTLSGGQKQRVALARTLAHEPALVLLDEPLSNLDAALKDSLRQEIRLALKTAGVSAVWVTHDQDEALSVGDRLGILNQGRLEQLADPESCFCRPASRFAAEFLGEASFLPGRLDHGMVSTVLGKVAVHPLALARGAVDLLVRPGDIRVVPREGTEVAGQAGAGRKHGDQANRIESATAETCRAEVLSCRYEGDTRLYTAKLADGATVRFRTSQSTRLSPGEPVSLNLDNREAMTAFSRR